MKPIELPAGARFLLDTLAINGFPSYIVGGCVRDSLLGLIPKDWDICTPAKPGEVKACLPDVRIIETGLKHGTVTVLLPDGQYEVTTFRIDGAYTDHRRPDSVEFVTDIKADLARRDFTVNAMAYNKAVGLVDPFGGQEDLANGLIRCVGEPRKRFCEDGLRIMRAIRFAGVYGFSIEKQTSLAIFAEKSLLKNIAAERIREELCKLLVGKGVSPILSEYAEVVATVIPECVPSADYTRAALAISKYTGDDIRVLLTLLLRAATPLEPETADRILSRLRFDNKTRRDVVQLFSCRDRAITPESASVRRLLSELGQAQFFRLIEERTAWLAAEASGADWERLSCLTQADALAKSILASNPCLDAKTLAINGEDILALGVREGKTVGGLLTLALNAVLDGTVTNDREALLSYLRLQLPHTE